MKKKRKFPQDVARFFNPHKTGTNELRDIAIGLITRLGTHQSEKAKERSYIPVYTKRGPAMRTMDANGRVVYVERTK